MWEEKKMRKKKDSKEWMNKQECKNKERKRGNGLRSKELESITSCHATTIFSIATGSCANQTVGLCLSTLHLAWPWNHTQIKVIPPQAAKESKVV